MKVLLRDIRTGFYYRTGPEWTGDKTEASDVGQIQTAITLALKARLERGEILLCYDDPSFDIALPFVRGGQNKDATDPEEIAQPEHRRRKPRH